jgi:hypothetical protein
LSRTEKFGLTCFILFLVPFCLVGIATAVMAIGEILEGNWVPGAFLGLFAIVFGGAGFGLLAMMFMGRAKMRKELELKAAYPAEPWKWCEDWSAGLSRSETKHTMFFAWGFAVMWNLISSPILYFLPSEIIDKENYPALLGLLFPLVGIGLLVWAVRETIEWKKFGESIFRMNSIPGVVGGELGGTIDVPASFDAGQGFDLTLSCVNRVRTGSGKNSSTTETILWQEKRNGVNSLARPEAMGAGILVKFGIPFECQDTNSANSNNLILWRLEAHAAVPGVDYHSRFEVPVFRTPASRPEGQGEALRTALPAGYQPSPESGITVGAGPAGGTEFGIKPKRAVGTILSLLGFFLLWTAIVVLIVHLDAPFIFWVVFGLFDFLFLFIILQLSFGESRILIDANSVTVTNSIAGFPSTVTIPESDIQTIKPSIGMQSGKSVLYSVTLVRQGGKESRIWVTMKEKHDAEWLAAEIQRHIEHRPF